MANSSSKQLIYIAVGVFVIVLGALLWPSLNLHPLKSRESEEESERNSVGVRLPHERARERLQALTLTSSVIERFLQAHEGDPVSVLCIAYILKDPSKILELYKDQFINDPIFAIHFLGFLPDVPDAESITQEIIAKDPENSIGYYYRWAQLVAGGGTEKELEAIRLDSLNASKFEDYGERLEEKAFEFLVDYMRIDPSEAARIITLERSFTPPQKLIGKLIQTLDDTESNASPDTIAAIYQLGTNLSESGDPINMAMGAGLEGMMYEAVLQHPELEFNATPDSIREEMEAARQSIYGMLSPEYQDSLGRILGGEQLNQYLEIRWNEGPRAAYDFVKSREWAGAARVATDDP